MRIRPLKPALLGAALLQRLELAVAQQFYSGSNIIQGRLLTTTGKPQETLLLTYARSIPQRAVPPVSLTLCRHDNFTPILPAPGEGDPGQIPRDGDPPKMVFTENDLTRSNMQPGTSTNGSITISNPAEVARWLYSPPSPPVAVYFVFSDGPESGCPQQGAMLFGMATPDVSQDTTRLDQYTAQMFPEPADGLPVWVTSTTIAQPTVTQYVSGDTRTPTPTSSPGEGGVSNPDSASPAQPAPNRSALSTGAIAGIAVGASLSVLLLATIMGWFCYWRHRRQKKKTGSSGLGYGVGQGRSGDMVAEKEANAIVAESPRSPYSEDGHHRDSTLIGGASAASSGAAGLMAAHHHDRDTAGEYPPYSDHPPTSTATAPPTISQPVARAGSSMSRSTADRSSAAIPGSAAPPPAIGEEGLPPRAETGMSGRYAHLVEDGMTPEEIARLEEEERQLDMAIEQARGVTTK